MDTRPVRRVESKQAPLIKENIQETKKKERERGVTKEELKCAQ